MIVKLKCVSNIDMFGDVSDYLTVGNIYGGEMIDGLVYSIDDRGCGFVIRPSGCAHGKWEVVSE